MWGPGGSRKSRGKRQNELARCPLHMLIIAHCSPLHFPQERPSTWATGPSSPEVCRLCFWNYPVSPASTIHLLYWGIPFGSTHVLISLSPLAIPTPHLPFSLHPVQSGFPPRHPTEVALAKNQKLPSFFQSPLTIPSLHLTHLLSASFDVVVHTLLETLSAPGSCTHTLPPVFSLQYQTLFLSLM